MSGTARILRKNPTDAERALWRHLRLRQVEGCRFRRQHPIGPYVVDFTCLDRKLVVEIDGGHHAGQVSYDTRRTAWLESCGYRVIRFWDHEVFRDPGSVAEVIRRALIPPPQSSPSRGEEARAATDTISPRAKRCLGAVLCAVGSWVWLSEGVPHAVASEESVKFFDCGVDYFGKDCKKTAEEEKRKPQEAPPPEAETPEKKSPLKSEQFEASLKQLAEEPTETNADTLAAMYVDGLNRAKLADELLNDALRRKLGGKPSEWKLKRLPDEGRIEPLGEGEKTTPSGATYDLNVERPVLLVFCQDTSSVCVDQLGMIKGRLQKFQKSMDVFLVTSPEAFTGAIQAGVPRRVSSGLYDRFGVAALPTFAVLTPKNGEARMWKGLTGPTALERKVKRALAQ